MNEESSTRRRRRKQIVALAFAFLLFVVALDVFMMRSIGNSSAPKGSRGPRPELVLQRGHSLGVNCVAFAPDGSWLASGGSDNSILIWQVPSGRQLRALTGHSGYIRSVAISSNGQWLASGSNDRTVKVWNVATGREIFTLTGHTGSIEALAFSPGGQWLASGSADRVIKIWDLTTGNELKTLNKHTAAVSVLTFSGNGEFLASSGDTAVIVWDTKTWQGLRTLRRHTAKVTAISFSHDASWMATASSDGSVLVWRNGSDRERFALNQDSSSVLALSFGLAGSLITVHSDGAVEAWDYSAGKERWSRPREANIEPLLFARLSADATILASSNGSRIVSLRNVNTGDLSGTLESHSTAVNSVAFSGDGRWFASATNDSSIRLWQIATGRELPRLSGHAGYVTTIAFSPDSRLLASGSRSGEVKVWDVSTPQLAFSLPTHAKGINVVVFSPDGKFLATAGMEQSVEVWNLDNKQARILPGHSEEITSVLFADNGGLLVSAGRDKTIRVWDLKTGDIITSLDNLGAEVNGLAVSPDGHLLAAANADKTVRLWNMTNPVPPRTLTGHAGEVLTVAFSPDSKVLASGSSDHSVMLWDLESGGNLRQLKGSAESVTGVAFSKDGRWILGGSDDGSMRAWNSAGELMATMVSMPNTDDWLVTTPDGLFDGSPESWNLMLWRFEENTFNVMPVEAYFNEFFYPGLLAEIFADKNPKASQDIVQKDRRQPRISMKVSGGANSSFATRHIDLELEVASALPDKDHANGSGAKDLRLFRNGLLIRTWTGDILETGTTSTLKVTVPIVAGENRISAYAFNNDNIKSLDADLLVKGANSLKRQGAAYLLVIGVEQYENAQYNLRYPAADANEMGDQLKAQQERLGRYNPIITIPLTNAQATKINILLALARLAGSNTEPLPLDAPPILSRIKPTQPEDAVVVYFSGHGTAVRDRFYLIPYDIGYKGSREELDPAGLTTILAHSISDEELVAALQSLDADQLLLVIDACNSGQAIESQEKRRGPMNTRGLAQLAYEKGIYVLTASQSIEVAFEADTLKHSYLAYALLEEGIKTGAADVNHDGNIFLKEWFDYANNRVPQIRRMRYQQRKQLVEDERDEQRVQRPRVFYTREAGAKQFLVAQYLN